MDLCKTTSSFINTTQLRQNGLCCYLIDHRRVDLELK